MSYTQEEKRYMSLIESNLQFFNCNRRKRLIVEYYVADGNRARVLWGHTTIADGLTIHEAHIFCWGFTRGREGR